MTKYTNLGAVKPWVQAAADELGTKFGITSIGGWRASATDPNGHPAGRALDYMCNIATGNRLAAYAQANARRLGIEYLIHKQHIWSVARSGEGWRLMEDRGSPTANHMDHVHANFTATAPAGGGAPVVPPPDDWTTGPSTPTNPSVQPVLDVPGVEEVTAGVERLVLLAAVLYGGVILIAIGAARLAKPSVDKAGAGAMQVAQFIPQAKVATAAAAASSTTKGATP